MMQQIYKHEIKARSIYNIPCIDLYNKNCNIAEYYKEKVKYKLKKLESKKRIFYKMNKLGKKASKNTLMRR